MKARSFAPALVVLAISAVVTGCFIVTSPPPEKAEPAATTATQTATAQPSATPEPPKVAVPKIFPGAPPAASSAAP